MDDSKQKAIEIIQQIIAMWPNFKDYESFTKWANFYKLRRKGYDWYCGATKACIMHKDLPDWVLKVEIAKGKKDYCYLEYNNYCLAKERGFDQYFAETIYLGEFWNTKWIMQRKADIECSRIIADWSARDTAARKIEQVNAKEFALIMFGDQEFVDFLGEIDALDLGLMNLGYIEDRLVIIDFTGQLWGVRRDG